ncbi:MAG: hypothetical protein ACOZE5_06810 [Verrucomicrobiota bacterium]
MQTSHSYPARRLAVMAGLLSLLLPSAGFGQGCVIARGGGNAMISDSSAYLEPGQWQITTAYRYFKSHRHFAGNDEQTHRSDQGTEVYNWSNFYDVTATYAWSRRLSLNLTVPYVHHNRSSLYEHLGNSSGRRFVTSASGLADLRASASWWIFNPNADNLRGNLAVAFGLKAPTGKHNATDIFTRSTGPTVRFVDSSIQPGDGGWGCSLELQGFRRVVHGLSLYGNAFYLFNPEGRDEETRYSIPDAYLARGGFDFAVPAVKGLSLSLGGRIEGVPGNDAFGSSIGSRRPGFAVAVEPGASFSRGRFSGTITVPIAVHRARTTTFGSIKAGDAAFADWTLNTSFTVRL